MQEAANDMAGGVNEKFGGTIAAPPSVRLWLRMLSCTLIIEKRLRRKFVEEFKTTLPRFDVMAALDRYPDGLRMSDLSRALLVSNGNVTSIVRQLSEQGLVRTDIDPNDRRSFIAFLTPQGQAQFDELARAHHQWIRKVMANFPSEKRQTLFTLLEELQRTIPKE